MFVIFISRYDAAHPHDEIWCTYVWNNFFIALWTVLNTAVTHIARAWTPPSAHLSRRNTVYCILRVYASSEIWNDALEYFAPHLPYFGWFRTPPRAKGGTQGQPKTKLSSQRHKKRAGLYIPNKKTNTVKTHVIIAKIVKRLPNW